MIPNGEIHEAKSEDAQLSSKDDNDIILQQKTALLRGITSKYHGNFYCLDCLHSFVTPAKS